MSPTERMYSAPRRNRSTASTSIFMSLANISGTDSPIRSANSFW
jgi:hypothetical protein